MASVPSVESASIEPLEATIRISPDPSATAPEFNVSGVDDTSPPSSGWVAGSWFGTWASKTERIVAHSATVGATGADFPGAEGTNYKMWMRYGTVIRSWGVFRIK